MKADKIPKKKQNKEFRNLIPIVYEKIRQNEPIFFFNLFKKKIRQNERSYISLSKNVNKLSQIFFRTEF